MATEHKDITDAERHPPKGASTATSGEIPVSDGAGDVIWKVPEPKGAGGANADEILVADGAGATAWQRHRTPVLGRLSLVNSTATVALTAGSIRSDASYVEVTSNFTQAINQGGMTFNGSNQFVIPRDGYYRVTVWFSVAYNKASALMGMDTKVNGVSAGAGSAVVTWLHKDINDRVVVTGFGEGVFSQNDTIGIAFASDTTGTLSLYDSVFSVEQIGQ